MTRAMKITFTVAAVIGFVSGNAYGWYNAEQASGFMQSAEVLSASSVTSEFALQQFEHADTAHARQAVLLQIRTVEQLEQVARDPGSDGQLGLAYIRLAMIEEASGQTEAERSALDQARRWFKGVHPRDELTDEQLKNALKQWDGAFDRL